MPIDSLRIDVTDADIARARREWLDARDGLAPSILVERRMWLYRQLISTQAQQIADDFRQARREASENDSTTGQR